MHVPLQNLRTASIDRNVGLMTRQEIIARVLNKQAFDDLCDMANAPTFFMKQLPATLACQVFNHRLRQRGSLLVEIVLDGETARAINF